MFIFSSPICSVASACAGVVEEMPDCLPHTERVQLRGSPHTEKYCKRLSSLCSPVKILLCMLKCLRSHDTHLGISRVVSAISKSLLCPVKEPSTGTGSNQSCCHRESISTDKVSVSNPEPFPGLFATEELATLLQLEQHNAGNLRGQEWFCCRDNNSGVFSYTGATLIKRLTRLDNVQV